MFREMRRKNRLLSDSEAAAMLHSCTSGVLAVQGDDGYPYAVPLSFAHEDGRLYFHSALAGHKIDALERSDKASFCVIAADDVVPDAFATHYRSAVAFGTARILTTDDEKIHALRCLARKYSPDYLVEAEAEIERDLERTCVFELLIEHMTGKSSV